MTIPVARPDRNGGHRTAPFVGIQVAQLISAFGNSLTAIAIPWFVLETTGSAGQTGIVAAAGLIPTLIAMALGSAAVDRFGFRRMSIVSDLLSMVTVAAIPLLYLTMGLNLPALLALVFLGALFDAPGATARAAMRPALARMAGITLSRANGIDQGGIGLATLLGPLAGGALVGLIGATNVLWINAGAFLVSVLLVALVVPTLRAEESNAPGSIAPTTYLEDVRAGWQFVLGVPLIRRIMSIAVLVNFVTSAMFAVLLPVFVNEEVGDARVLGVMMAAFGVGSLIGVALFSWRGEGLRRTWALVGGVGAFIAVCGAFVSGVPWQVVAVVTALAGLVAAPINPIVMTVVQERVPEAMLGRVMGAVYAAALLAAPAGVLVAGVLAEGVGPRPAFLAAGLVMAVATLWTAVDPLIRTMDQAGQAGHLAGPNLPPVVATGTTSSSAR
ncbi:MAG TPA: MFS transporter [Thermomicrobiales bacterium]|nr:MFS transporter [Thermomicrobiales bacterium]